MYCNDDHGSEQMMEEDEEIMHEDRMTYRKSVSCQLNDLSNDLSGWRSGEAATAAIPEQKSKCQDSFIVKYLKLQKPTLDMFLPSERNANL